MASGIFFVTETNSPNLLQTLIDRLIKLYDPTTLPRWNLEHRLFRSTPHSKEDKTNPRFLHLLTASYINQDQTYIYISPINRPVPDEKDGASNGDENSKSSNNAYSRGHQSIIAIPKSQSESHYRLLEISFGALWMPRFTLVVNNGVAFDLGEFIVRLAEVRQADIQHTFKGVAVAIDAILPSRSGLGDVGANVSTVDEKSDKVGGGIFVQSEEVKEMIREMWRSFSKEDAKETWVPVAKDETTGMMGRNARLAQMWCEALQKR